MESLRDNLNKKLEILKVTKRPRDISMNPPPGFTHKEESTSKISKKK